MSIFDDIGGALGSVVGGLAGGILGPTPQASAQLQNVATPAQAAQQYGNVQQGIGSQQALIDAMRNAGGQNTYANQMALQQQLQQQANGQGPNPAQAQLQQNSANAAAQQASLMAGQRGTAGNAGLMARQIGMQGAQQQQQMMGQAATLQAQQQLAAQQQLGAQQAQMAGQMQGASQGYNQAAGNAYGQTLGGIGQQNANQVNLAGAQAGLEGQRAGATASIAGGLLGGAGAALGLKKAHGGIIPSISGPQSQAGQHFHNMKSGGNVPGQAKVAGDSLKNDNQPAMLSPGEIVIPRSIATGKNAPEKAAAFVRACLAKGKR
jgi:hypothetical protein